MVWGLSEEDNKFSKEARKFIERVESNCEYETITIDVEYLGDVSVEEINRELFHPGWTIGERAVRMWHRANGGFKVTANRRNNIFRQGVEIGAELAERIITVAMKNGWKPRLREDLEREIEELRREKREAEERLVELLACCE